MGLLNTCGIISYIGTENGIPYLVEGIKKLEYRGYDSFGCAFKEGGKLKILKDVGRIDSVIQKYGIEGYSSHIGIFHTRWATTGVIEKKNAHPFSDCGGKIAIVHNGIVENWDSLKRLIPDHTFSSDTDSEVIAHLIEDRMRSGSPFYESVKETASEMKGSSSFVAINSESEEMVAVKNGSPLILALSDEGFFVSSDIPSVLKFTDKIVYLHDGDIVNLSPISYKIENIFNFTYNHDMFRVKTPISSTDLGSYSHFMEKEIHDQIEIWNSNDYLSIVQMREAAEHVKMAGRVFIIGSGSSFFASLHGAWEFRKRGKDAIAILPQDIGNYSRIIRKDDVFIFVSQSGETADVISRLEKINGHLKIGIINVDHSYLSRAMDIVIPMNVGIENAVAATKSLTNSMIILTILAAICCGNEERIKSDYNLLKLNDFNLIVPSVEQALDEVADIISRENHLFVAGKGEAIMLAREGALKMKEVTYIHTEALDLSSLKHGPIALIENGVKVITVVMDNDEDSDYNIDELKARGATIIGFSPTNSPKYDKYIRTVPAGAFSFAPTLYALQLLSYKTAIKRGINPDRPRNLAKSVTVK